MAKVMQMKNRYEIRGNDLIIFLDRKDGTVYETVTDVKFLPKLMEFRYKWYKTSHGYVAAKVSKSSNVYMHRFLTDAEDDVLVDHRDGNGLNNRESNLRKTDQVGNGQNRHKLGRGNKSGKLNVHRIKNGRYRAQVWNNGKRVHLGYFDTPEQAYEAVFKYRSENMPTSQEAARRGMEKC